MSTTEYPKGRRDPAFTVRLIAPQGPGVPDLTAGAARVLPDDPDEQLAALNARAGEILTEQRIVAATTEQLTDAIVIAERELGVSYGQIRDRQRGVVAAASVEVAGYDADDLAVRADAYIASLKLDREPTQDEYVAAIEHVRGVAS